jgi:hypothetical protein
MKRAFSSLTFPPDFPYMSGAVMLSSPLSFHALFLAFFHLCSHYISLFSSTLETECFLFFDCAPFHEFSFAVSWLLSVN